jgi:mannosylglucosylglycerate synthase
MANKLYKRQERKISKMNYGIIHSQIGFDDGVSIVIEQVEDVMKKYLKIPKSHIFYLTGKSKISSKYIKQSKILWHKNPINQLLNQHFNKGFGGALSEKIETGIWEAKKVIKEFIENKKIDILIVHNSSHPVNFISSIAISRYFRDQINSNKEVPKYIIWWHDSHLERERYKSPSRDIKNYILEGVPGRYVNYIIFINRLQFDNSQEYLMELDSRSPGLYKGILKNHTVIYNTSTNYINNLGDLNKEKYSRRVEKFLKEFKINDTLSKNNLTLKDVQFCLQHTRIVPRKKIDFALEYNHEFFSRLKKENMAKAFFFIISGPSGDESGDYKKELIELNKKLIEKYNNDKFFMIFSEDINTELSFEEIPLLIAKLGGYSTYFSEIEGFGNNLLEVLAAGLIPVIYAYPVYLKELSNYNFNVVQLNKYEITPESIDKMLGYLKNDECKRNAANSNIRILKKNFSNRIIAPKLRRAIIKE